MKTGKPMFLKTTWKKSFETNFQGCRGRTTRGTNKGFQAKSKNWKTHQFKRYPSPTIKDLKQQLKRPIRNTQIQKYQNMDL